MKIAFYPGSFNPFHEGHDDVIEKALQLFDKVVVLKMDNSTKQITENDPHMSLFLDHREHVEVLVRPKMSIISAIGNYLLGLEGKHDFAIIRGLRNEKDFCDEQILTYWYQDLGIKMPIFHIIADRDLVHISSSAIKAANIYTEKI